MATARKKFNPKGPVEGDQFAYAEFIASVLDGTIKASKLVESRKPNGKPDFSYDDPNG